MVQKIKDKPFARVINGVMDYPNSQSFLENKISAFN